MWSTSTSGWRHASTGCPSRARPGARSSSKTRATSATSSERTSRFASCSDHVADIVELDDDGLCCGAGGAYSALQPALASTIRDRKVAAIGRAATRSGATTVASANPGCAMHLGAAGLDVRHPVDIVADALGVTERSLTDGSVAMMIPPVGVTATRATHGTRAASPATRRLVAPDVGLLRLQRQAGNAATTLLVARRPLPVVQRAVLHRKGSRGEPVRRIQQQLNDLGASPALSADGDFGGRTDAAVRTFQAAHNLRPDGIVGEFTSTMLDNEHALHAGRERSGPCHTPEDPGPDTAFEGGEARRDLELVGDSVGDGKGAGEGDHPL